MRVKLIYNICVIYLGEGVQRFQFFGVVIKWVENNYNGVLFRELFIQKRIAYFAPILSFLSLFFGGRKKANLS